MGFYSSATRQGAFEPFELQVARGQNGQITQVNQSTFVQKQEVPYTCPVPHIEKTDMQFTVKANTGSPFTVSCY